MTRHRNKGGIRENHMDMISMLMYCGVTIVIVRFVFEKLESLINRFLAFIMGINIEKEKETCSLIEIGRTMSRIQCSNEHVSNESYDKLSLFRREVSPS
jgi:hypothetical protein